MRPLSLCNALVKILAKVLVNRMKKVMDNVVSKNQSAFIRGRIITYNIIISYEMMHFLKRKRMGKDGYMALKVNMSKAYDRIKWVYL